MKKILIFATMLLAMTACQESIEKRLAREAREITEKGPQPMQVLGNDGKMHTMIRDSVVFDIASLTEREYFTMTGDIDTIGTAPTKEALVSQLRNAPAYRIHRERGYSFYFLYRSAKNPKQVYSEITITKKDYE
ncbi:MAG: hypothetical protein K6G08_04250 [Prevotella sp.]|nr:hypothetical protein [Prevotella sp.]